MNLAEEFARRERVAQIADEYRDGQVTFEEAARRVRASGDLGALVGELQRRRSHEEALRCPGRLRGHDLCPLRAGHFGACDGRAWNE